MKERRVSTSWTLKGAFMTCKLTLLALLIPKGSRRWEPTNNKMARTETKPERCEMHCQFEIYEQALIRVFNDFTNESINFLSAILKLSLHILRKIEYKEYLLSKLYFYFN